MAHRPLFWALFAGVLRLLGEAGVPVPPLSQLAVMDPRLLCWLLEPHPLQVGWGGVGQGLGSRQVPSGQNFVQQWTAI